MRAERLWDNDMGGMLDAIDMIGSGVSPKAVAHAILVVCGSAEDVDDARLLLGALGLFGSAA